jgi:hypothetical protein
VVTELDAAQQLLLERLAADGIEHLWVEYGYYNGRK